MMEMLAQFICLATLLNSDSDLLHLILKLELYFFYTVHIFLDYLPGVLPFYLN